MARFTIDGRAFAGRRIRITRGGSVLVDGRTQEGALQGRVEVHVTEGILESLEVHGDVHCGAVSGDVEAGGSVTCGDVGGDVDAGGSVTCGAVAGDVGAGGSVSCSDVNGDVDAGGSVSCTDVGGDVDAGGEVTINRRT
jgi:hypothetical protein